MSGDFFTSFANSVPLWLLPLVVGIYIWGKMVRAGLNPEHPESFQRTVRWLRQDNFGLLYLNGLGWLLDKVSGWIGDREKLNRAYVTSVHSRGVVERVFGFNSFTHESYERSLQLACLYPALIFILMAVLGGKGDFGSFKILGVNDLNLIPYKYLLYSIPLWFGMGMVLLKVSLLKQWFYLLFVFLIVSGGYWGVLFFGGGVLPIGDFVLLQYLQGGFFSSWEFFIKIYFFCYLGFALSHILLRKSLRLNSKEHAISFFLAYSMSVIMPYFPLLGPISPFVSGILFLLFVLFSYGISVTLFLASTVFSAFFVGFLLHILEPCCVEVFQESPILGQVIASFILPLSYFVLTFLWGLFIGFNQAIFKHPITYYVGFNAFVFMLGYYFLLETEFGSVYFSIFLMWVFFPIINSVLDWGSLSVSRGLLQAIRVNGYSLGGIVLWGFFDFLWAVFFLFLIGALFVLAILFGNYISNEILIDINLIFIEINKNPEAPDHYWIYFMMLSTLVPTLIHFALAGGAATLWLPRNLRLKLADGLEKDIHKTHMAWAYLTFTPVIGFILVPIGLLYGLWWIISSHGTGLGGLLLDWAQIVAGTGSAPAMPQ